MLTLLFDKPSTALGWWKNNPTIPVTIVILHVLLNSKFKNRLKTVDDAP